MVESMCARPPQRPLLYGRCAQESEDELKNTSCFVAAVREVTMVSTGDCEHPKEEKADAQDDSGCGHPSEKNQETRKLNTQVEAGREELSPTLPLWPKFQGGRFRVFRILISCIALDRRGRCTCLSLHDSPPILHKNVTRNVCTGSADGMRGAVKVS